MRAPPDDRYRLSEQPSRVKRALCVLAAGLILLLASLPAWGQPQGPTRGPMFTLTPYGLLCGSQEDHERIMLANEFEQVWLGRGSDGNALEGITIWVRRNDASWVAMVTRVSEHCVIASGSDVPPPPPTRE